MISTLIPQIRDKGVAVTALILSQGRSSILPPNKETIDESKRKRPDIDRLFRAADIADRVVWLTQGIAGYLEEIGQDPDIVRAVAAAGLDVEAKGA